MPDSKRFLSRFDSGLSNNQLQGTGVEVCADETGKRLSARFVKTLFGFFGLKCGRKESLFIELALISTMLLLVTLFANNYEQLLYFPSTDPVAAPNTNPWHRPCSWSCCRHET